MEKHRASGQRSTAHPDKRRACGRGVSVWGMGIRTVEAMGIEPTNLLHAMQALYQLSYAPRWSFNSISPAASSR
jgi:hypothetical protein